MSRPRGKPPLPEGEARDHTLRVRVQPAFAERLRDTAKRRGMSVSDAVRDALARWMEAWR